MRFGSLAALTVQVQRNQVDALGDGIWDAREAVEAQAESCQILGQGLETGQESLR